MKKGIVLVLLGLMSGCGLLPKEEDETAGWSAQKLYSKGKEEMDGGNYEVAIKNFEKLQSRYPYGRYAQQAQIETAYAYYKNGDNAAAIAECDRFIKLHPNHPSVDYIYYLKGLISFIEDLGFLDFVGRQDLTERDPKSARESFDAFKEMITRFPDSKYAPDAQARMKYLINALAAHDVHVARYYLRRGALVAAVNRAQIVVETYPQAPSTEEALAIMIKCYDTLGINDLRDDALRVMKLNFPNSPYLTKKLTHDESPWWKFWGEDQFMKFW